MMLDHLGEPEAALAIERAFCGVLAGKGPRTPDLGGNASTAEVGAIIAGEI
jgi:tartrate dehydrogenase/decarboxylase/D-malate dehydrogenase